MKNLIFLLGVIYSSLSYAELKSNDFDLKPQEGIYFEDLLKKHNNQLERNTNGHFRYAAQELAFDGATIIHLPQIKTHGAWRNVYCVTGWEDYTNSVDHLSYCKQGAFDNLCKHFGFSEYKGFVYIFSESSFRSAKMVKWVSLNINGEYAYHGSGVKPTLEGNKVMVERKIVFSVRCK